MNHKHPKYYIICPDGLVVWFSLRAGLYSTICERSRVRIAVRALISLLNYFFFFFYSPSIIVPSSFTEGIQRGKGQTCSLCTMASVDPYNLIPTIVNSLLYLFHSLQSWTRWHSLLHREYSSVRSGRVTSIAAQKPTSLVNLGLMCSLRKDNI